MAQQGAVVSCLSVGVIAWSISKTGPVLAASYSPFQAVPTAIFAFIFLKEAFYLGRYVQIGHLLSFLLRHKADKPMSKHGRQFTTWQVFRQVERRLHSHDLNRRPLSWDLGISPPSSGSLWSSRSMSPSFLMSHSVSFGAFRIFDNWITSVKHGPYEVIPVPYTRIKL